MKKSRVAALVASIAIIVGSSFVSAPAASAAVQNLTVTCGHSVAGSFPVTNITAAQGDTVNVTPDPTTCVGGGAAPYARWGVADQTLYFSTPDNQVAVPFVYTVLGNAPLGTMAYAANGLPYFCDNCILGASLRFTIVAPGGDTAGSSPADVLQQRGASSIGTCEGVVDNGLDYGTGLTGGWSLSWAEWVNSGHGGAVCTRTLHFNSAWSRWVLS